MNKFRNRSGCLLLFLLLSSLFMKHHIDAFTSKPMMRLGFSSRHHCNKCCSVRWMNSEVDGKVNDAAAQQQPVADTSGSYLQKHRFWTKQFSLSAPTATAAVAVEGIDKVLQQQFNSSSLQDVEMGIVIAPKFGLLVPIHENRLQSQHALILKDLQHNASEATAKDFTVCGFSPRAQHVSISPQELDRPVNEERLQALDAALKAISGTANITGIELLSEEFAGTPPARIYRSFVAPRLKAKHILEPVERAAARTAAQIELALRQVRADQAAYLRNTDRSSQLLLSAVEDNDSSMRTVHPVALVLDNIRSAFNVGSIFRSAETAGAAEIVTCGITAHPPHPKLRKTAFSAVEVVPSRHFSDVMIAIETLKKEGYFIAVMETTAKSQLYTKFSFPKKTALVVGNEVTGVDARVIEAADVVVEIPTFGVKNSLNVASAAPIVLFELLRQWNVDEAAAS